MKKIERRQIQKKPRLSLRPASGVMSGLWPIVNEMPNVPTIIVTRVKDYPDMRCCINTILDL